jgi:NAD(P)-dependent dehydrogenase (short-subunit alcohol dehydrogenase family)
MKVLVTGASRGIGRAVARLLHDAGAELAISARSVSQLSEPPGAVALAADLRQPQAAAELVQRAAEALGGLDALVHCAGVVHYASLVAVTPAELGAQLQLNFVSAFELTQAAAVQLRGRAGASIVFVASTLGLRPAAGTAAYSASKAALISLTRSAALELAELGIRVNAVAPGVIDTDMIRVVRGPDAGTLSAAESAARIEKQLAQLAALHPLGRLGTPDEVAEAVGYLLHADFVTGTVLLADGGLTLQA